MLQIKIKSFGSNKILENIDLSISKNGIYGIVGKNGQCKTTFFRCLNSLTDFDGSVVYNGENVVLNQIAWCPTEPTIYDELTANEFYKFYSELLKIENTKSEMLFDVPNDNLIKEFSTGMKKKAYLNAVLQKKHQIYIFDEPFNGLDIESNYLLMKYIVGLSKNSIVFISSHILETLYKYCDLIFVLKNTAITSYNKNEFHEIEKSLFELK